MSDARLAQPLFGFDYTSEIPTGMLHSLGCRFVIRYLSRSSWKVLTKSEAQHLEAAGIGIALVFEDGAKNAWLGHEQGQSDADFAYRQACDIFGGDRGGKITFAVDNPTSGKPQVTDPYFDGVGSHPKLGKARSGPYGDVYVVGHQASRGFGALFQTYAWSSGRLDGRAQLYQYSNAHTVGGHGVDFDHVYYADYGQWNARPVPPHPVSKYTIHPTDVHAPSLANKGNERLTVEQAAGALEHPDKFHAFLKGKMFYELKGYRDRIWRVSWYLPPDFNRKRRQADWGDNRGTRWQLINNLMKRIAAL